MPETLAQRIRAKYPGAYDDLSDTQLEQQVRAKFPGAYDDIPTTVEKPAASTAVQQARAKVNTPSLGRQIATAAADVAVGAGKGLLNTAIGAGQFMHDYVPPVRWASQAVQLATQGDVQDADPLFEAARREVAPQNTAERVGFGGEQLAEFVALPASKGRVLARAAQETLTGGGLAALQGSGAAGAGVTAALSGAAPVVGGAVAKAAPALKESALKSVVQALGPTKERFKAMAEKLAPEFLTRDIGGVLGKNRKAIYEEARAEARAAGAAVDRELQNAGSRILNTQDVVDALEKAKDAFRVDVAITPAHVARNPKLAQQAANGNPTVTVALDSRPIRQLSKLQDVIQNLGPNATVEQLVAVRRAWDAIVDQAGGFAQRAKGAIGVPLKDASEASAKREATKAIRGLLERDVPELAAVNKEFAFWKSLSDVTNQTLQRTAPQTKGLGRQIMTGAGVAAGIASGDSTYDKVQNAALFGLGARKLDALFSSPRWKLATARMKNDLAEAIVSGSAGRVSSVIARINAGSASQVAR